MSKGFWKRELPLPLQFGGLSVVWLAWFATVGWVFWKVESYSRAGLCLAHPKDVVAISMFGFPLVLAIAGTVINRRLKCSYDWPVQYRILHPLFLSLTLLAAGVCLFGALIVLTTHDIRE